MMTDYMTEGRFLDLIEAYGADPARWPEAERKAATAFVEAHADFAEPLLAEAQALDDRLGPAEIEPSDLLQARLLAALPAESGAGAGAGVKREEKGPLVRGVFSGWRAPVAAAGAEINQNRPDQKRSEQNNFMLHAVDQQMRRGPDHNADCHRMFQSRS